MALNLTMLYQLLLLPDMKFDYLINHITEV
jgi:hypothetical protein